MLLGKIKKTCSINLQPISFCCQDASVHLHRFSCGLSVQLRTSGVNPIIKPFFKRKMDFVDANAWFTIDDLRFLYYWNPDSLHCRTVKMLLLTTSGRVGVVYTLVSSSRMVLTPLPGVVIFWSSLATPWDSKVTARKKNMLLHWIIAGYYRYYWHTQDICPSHSGHDLLRSLQSRSQGHVGSQHTERTTLGNAPWMLDAISDWLKEFMCIYGCKDT